MGAHNISFYYFILPLLLILAYQSALHEEVKDAELRFWLVRNKKHTIYLPWPAFQAEVYASICIP